MLAGSKALPALEARNHNKAAPFCLVDSPSCAQAVHGWLFARVLKDRVNDASSVGKLNALEFSEDAKQALRQSKQVFEQKVRKGPETS